MASSTSCASNSNSVPARGLNLSSTCTQCSFATLPFSPENFCVAAERLAGDAAVLLRQEIHCEMDAVKIAAGDHEVARRFGAAGQRQRVILIEHLARIDRAGRRAADMDAVMEGDALGFHLR